ncbi:unnamed protein product [Closterium sp. NIES-54]
MATYQGGSLSGATTSSDCNDRSAATTRRVAAGPAVNHQQVLRAKGQRLTREDYVALAAARRRGSHAADTGATSAIATEAGTTTSTTFSRSASNGAANSAAGSAAAAAAAAAVSRRLQPRRHSLGEFNPPMSLPLSASTPAAFSAAAPDADEDTLISSIGSRAISGVSEPFATASHGCLLDELPDDVLVNILAALGSARHVATAGAVCRRWRRLVPFVPSLAFARLSLPPAKIEEVVSRMVMRSHGLSSLHVESLNCGGSHGSVSGASSAHPREFIVEAWARHAGSSLRHVTLTQPKAVTAAGYSAANSAGSSDSPSCTVYAGGPDLSSHLQHLASHCPNLSSMRLGSFTLPPHSLRGCSVFPHLRTLSLEWINLAGSTLQSLLDSCPNLRHLSILVAAGLNAQDDASNPAGYAALQAAAGARATAFAAAGRRELCLRLPPRLEYIELAYLRVSAVTLICSEAACIEDNCVRGGLREVSIRDMFLNALSLPNVRALKSISIATASALRLSAPASAALASLEVRAGSVHWPSLESLVAGAGVSLNHLALDLFTVECGGFGAPRSGAAADPPREAAARDVLDGTRGVTATTTAGGSRSLDLLNLDWLTGHCPNLSSLSLGPLPWECLIRGGCITASGWSSGSGSDAGGSAEVWATLVRVMNPVDVEAWPSQLENLSVKIRGRSGATLLWIGAFMRQCAGSLKSVEVVCMEDEEEEDEDEEEEAEEEEEEEDDEECSEYGSEIQDDEEQQEGMEIKDEGSAEEWDREVVEEDMEESTACTVLTSSFPPTLSDARQKLIAGRLFFSSALDALQRAFPHVGLVAPFSYA